MRKKPRLGIREVFVKLKLFEKNFPGALDINSKSFMKSEDFRAIIEDILDFIKISRLRSKSKVSKVLLRSNIKLSFECFLTYLIKF